MKATTLDAQKLFQEGMIALADVEANGIRIDKKYLHETIKDITKKADKLEDSIKKDLIYKLWYKRFKEKTKICGGQLAEVLYKDLKYDFKNFTDKNHNPKADEETLKKIKLNVVQDFLKLEKYNKLANTFLNGIRQELVDGYLHPFFNLHTVISYRSSSSNPNFQNLPVRDPFGKQVIRSCFIPREGRQILELDFKGIEVGISACYNKDKNLIAYVKDTKNKDMHRDMAMECYMLKKEEISKETRYCAKNRFVFPQFYGSYYVDCAEALWQSLDGMNLHLEGSGIDSKAPRTIRGHLAKKGIKELGECNPEHRPVPGTFEYHIKEIEERFWNIRFPGFKKWKQQWWNDYQEKGEFSLLTGFTCRGVYKRNECINLGTQGTAFHCLLWCLIELNKWLKKEKMKSLIIGQVHDSIELDVVPSERDKLLKKAHQLMTKELPAHWKWIIVPLEIEAEITPINKSWYYKKGIEIPK